MESKFPTLIKKYIEPQLEPIIGMDLDKYYENEVFFGYRLQPIKEIHLKSNIDNEIGTNGSIILSKIISILPSPRIETAHDRLLAVFAGKVESGL